jgi:acyl-CoA thioester hydrolase
VTADPGWQGPTDRVPPFRFSGRMRVDFSDTDAAGIVYYGRYTHYFDRAAMAYRRHLGLPLLGGPGHALVVRALRIEFHAPARFDDPLEVFVRISRIGRTSHTFAMRVERLDPHATRLLADGEVVFVGLDRHGGRTTPFPDDQRRRIIAFEGDALEPA